MRHEHSFQGVYEIGERSQVIHTEVKKEDGNNVVYTSGSIENLLINKAIVDVLEGTRPAFDMRDAKYQ